MRWPGGQHLFFAVDQVAGVKARDLEAVPVGDRIRGTSLDAVSAEDASIVVDVINLGVALRPAYSMLGRILRRLDVNAVRGTGCRAQKASDALFQSVLIALQDVDAAKTLLELGAPKRSRPVRVVLDLRGLKHLHEGNAHALGDGRNVFQHWHTRLVYRKQRAGRRMRQRVGPWAGQKVEFGSAAEVTRVGSPKSRHWL
jgi:hypothetical protein